MVLTVRRRTVFGNRRVVVADFTLPSSYTTGGVLLTRAMLGLGALDFIEVSGAGGRMYEYVYATERMRVLNPDTGVVGPAVEVAAGTNLAAITIRIIAIGV